MDSNEIGHPQGENQKHLAAVLEDKVKTQIVRIWTKFLRSLFTTDWEQSDEFGRWLSNMTFMYAKANPLNDELGRVIQNEQIWLDSIEGQIQNLGNDPET